MMQGDSGGPLKIGNVVIGVVSKGADTAECGAPGIPGFYTRVSSFLNWINENTAPSGRNRLSANADKKSSDTAVSKEDDESNEDDDDD